MYKTHVSAAIRDEHGIVRAEIRVYPGGADMSEVFDVFGKYTEGAAFRPWAVEVFGDSRFPDSSHVKRCKPGKPCAKCRSTALSWWTTWDNRRVAEQAEAP